MGRKVWRRPLTRVQQFEANEYVAACGDSGVVYKFKCDAGGGVYGSVYEETNGIPGLQTGRRGDTELADIQMVGSVSRAFTRVIKLTKQNQTMRL